MTAAARSPAEAANRLSGILLMCLAMLLFAVLDTAAKYAGQFVPALEVAFARYALSLVFAVIILRPWRNFAAYRTQRPIAQALRGIFLLGSTVSNFLALGHLQLAETASITFATPFLVVALAGPLLGDWAGPRRYAAVIVGFIGVLVVVHPGVGTFQPAALYSVASAFFYAGYNLATRFLSATESTAGMLIYPALLATAILSPTLPIAGVAPPNWVVWAALPLTGVMGAVGHWCLIVSYAKAPASLVAPFQYSQILWMPLLGYLVFADVPKGNTLLGAAIIVASGLYILYRERVRGGH